MRHWRYGLVRVGVSCWILTSTQLHRMGTSRGISPSSRFFCTSSRLESASDQVSKWSSQQVTKWPSDQISKWPSQQMIKSPSDQVTKWSSHQVIKSPSDQVTKWSSHQITNKKPGSQFWTQRSQRKTAQSKRSMTSNRNNYISFYKNIFRPILYDVFGAKSKQNFDRIAKWSISDAMTLWGFAFWK